MEKFEFNSENLTQAKDSLKKYPKDRAKIAILFLTLCKLFDIDVGCIWLDENLDTIKIVFDIRGKKYNNTKYYTIYQLLITLLKKCF